MKSNWSRVDLQHKIQFYKLCPFQDTLPPMSHQTWHSSPPRELWPVLSLYLFRCTESLINSKPVALKVILAQSSPYWLRPWLQLNPPLLLLLTSASFPHWPTHPRYGYWSQRLSLRGCCSTNSLSQLASKEINLQPQPKPALFQGDITIHACQGRPLFSLLMTNLTFLSSENFSWQVLSLYLFRFSLSIMKIFLVKISLPLLLIQNRYLQ